MGGHPIELTTTPFDLPPTGLEPVYEDENVLVSATRVDHDVDVPNAGWRAIFSGPGYPLGINSDFLIKNAGMDSLMDQCRYEII